jgi:hypothetical protein
MHSGEIDMSKFSIGAYQLDPKGRSDIQTLVTTYQSSFEWRIAYTHPCAFICRTCYDSFERIANSALQENCCGRWSGVPQPYREKAKRQLQLVGLSNPENEQD